MNEMTTALFVTPANLDMDGFEFGCCRIGPSAPLA